MKIENYDLAASKSRGRPFLRRLSVRLRGALLLAFGISIPTAFAQTSDAQYAKLIRSADQSMAAGRYPASQSELEAAIKLAPLRAGAWTKLGLLYDRENDFRNAEASLRHSLQLDSEQALAHYLLGLTLIANPGEKLDWPVAIQAFRDAIRLDPNDPDAMDRLGVGLQAIGHTEEAIGVLEDAIKLAPKKAGPHFDLGLALESKGDLEAAVAQYRVALNAKPDYSEAASALGKLLSTQNHVEEAEKTLIAALRINPDLQDAHYALGSVLKKEKKPEQAQHEFEEAVALDQRVQQRIDSLQLSNGALTKAANDDFAGAEEDLRKAVRLRPDYGVPHYNLGLILADRQKMTEAAKQLSLAISLLPGRPQPWIDLAKLQSRLGDQAAARRSIDQALELAPESEIALKEAEALQAVPLANSAPVDRTSTATMTNESLTVDTVTSHSDLARELELQADWVDASGQWLRVLALEPAAEIPRLELADCYQHLGDSAAAILEARKVLLVNPSSVRAHLTLGNALLSGRSPK